MDWSYYGTPENAIIDRNCKSLLNYGFLKFCRTLNVCAYGHSITEKAAT